MVNADPNGKTVREQRGSFLSPHWVYHFESGDYRSPDWDELTYQSMLLTQESSPVPLGSKGRRTWWLFRRSFYWEEQGYIADEVKTLVSENAQGTPRPDVPPMIPAFSDNNTPGRVSTGLRIGGISLVVIIALGVFIGLCLCVFAFFSLPFLVPKTTYDVEYFVACPGGVSLTYNNENGDTEQIKTSCSSQNTWQKDFKAHSGDFLYVSGQTEGYAVGCLISVNGKVFKQSQSNGQYTIATCSGRLP